MLNSTQLTDFAIRYAAAWSGQNAASLAAFYAENGSLTVNDGAASVGRAAIAATARSYMVAFPDMVVKMDHVSQEGSRAVFHWTWTGTNSGPGGTGKAVRISGYEEWTLRADGLIADSKGHFDEAEYQRQLRSDAPSVCISMKPDFSGEYVLNRQTSTLSPGAAAIQSGVVHIEHADPMFRYQATFVAGGKTFAYSFERVSDGREVAATEDEVASLRWEGDALVAMDWSKSPDAELTIAWRYELHDSGRCLRAIERIRGRGRDQDNVWVFDRR